MPLRAGNLGRVSHDKSGTVRSVGEQHEANHAEIDAHGWLETGKYEDEGSASRFATKTREDWLRLQSDLDAGHLDVVVMWDTSRGSREPEDWFAFLRRCRDRQVLIYVTTEERTYDVRIARDWKTLADAGVDNAYDSEKKSRDVKRGLAANRRNGLPHGICKYGFERIHDEKSGALLGQRPVPGHAAVVAEIIRRIAAAEPISAIYHDLTKREVPPPAGKVWYRRTIVRIATSVAYIGKMRVDGELLNAQWPPISDDPKFEETFWAAQHVLSAPERKTTRPGKAKHLLSYIMICGECGAKVYADLPRKKMITTNYMCSDAHRHCARIPMGDADEFVTLAVQRRLASPDFRRNITTGGDERVMQARAEAGRLRAELDEWATADISAHAFAIREAKLLPLIEAAEARAEELTVPLPLRDLATAGTDIAGRWDAMVVAAKRDVIRLLFPGLRLLPGEGPAHERIVHEEAQSRAG